jgi:hypothetical protein
MVGTCVHGVIEQAVNENIKTGEWQPLDHLHGLFELLFDEATESDEIRWVKRTPERARGFGMLCLETWHDHLMPYLVPVATEVPFDKILLWHDDHRTVTLTGTVDYIDRHWGLTDWKTASRPYVAWEKERWAIQPTVYCHVASLGTFDSVAPDLNPEQFTFAVMVDGEDEPQLVTVGRPRDEWAGWLQKQVLSIVPLIEQGIDPWMRNDQSALCSPKWCPVWDVCKGAHLSTPAWTQRQ